MNTWRILHGDVRERLADLPDASVQCVVTSPPYFGLRNYGVPGQLGLEPTSAHYVAAMVGVFSGVRRVLRDDGVLWLNIGDSYNAYNGGAGPGSKLSKTQTEQRPQLLTGFGLQDKSLKPKDLMMIPARVALALQADGWYLRSDIIWSKPNPMPESVTDRPTKAHEYVFLLTKRERYYYDAAAIYEPYAESTLREIESEYQGLGLKDYDGAGVQNPSDTKRRIVESIRKRQTAGESKREQQGERARTTPVGRSCGLNEALIGRNRRSVWHVNTQPYPEAHFATFPEKLVEPCILAGSRIGDIVLDPFAGSGTTGAVAIGLQRDFIGIELNGEYVQLARRRIGAVAPLLAHELTA